MINLGMRSSPSSWSVLIVALLTLFALTAGISLSVPSASSLTSMLSPARRPRSFAKSLGIETESVEYPTFWSLLVSSKVSIYQSLLYEPYSYTEESTFAEQFGFEEKRLLLDDRRCSRQRGRYLREHLREGRRFWGALRLWQEGVLLQHQG